MNHFTEPQRFDSIDTQQIMHQARCQKDEPNIWFGEQRMLLLQLSSLANFRKEQILTLGLERAKGFFMRLGYNLGQRDAELVRNQFIDASPEELFRAGLELQTLKGSVRVEEILLETNIEKSHFFAQLEMHDSYEAEMQISELGLKTGPCCWALMGHISSLASALLGQEIIFKEKECRGCNHSACLFEGRPAKEWEDYASYRKYFNSTPIIEELYELQDQLSVLRDKITESDTLGNFLGQSEGFKTVCNLAKKASSGKVSVLLLGETGVGKELVAKGIHENSQRNDKPFVAVNCAAIPPELIESELFGVEKGAYTGATQSRAGRFERASKGTIFLDEVIELTPRAQATLLRVLQEEELERVGDSRTRKVDVRVIAATNESLLKAVDEGRFRADLYYRLNVYPINIPPLRERREDIPLLVSHFLKKYESFYNIKTLGLSELAMKTVLNYTWPGNVRELENIIERGLILAENGVTIDAQHLFPSFKLDKNSQVISSLGSLNNDQAPTNDVENHNLKESWLNEAITQVGSMEKIEESILKYAIEKAESNVSEAARMLGMSRPTFSYRLKKLNIEV
ncbi:MAG: sigma-54-dependent Fis family transcriptional regulator [Colwellia sp.]|nr:sigma-54-dependent Fis family transcriptional regulator [Colwellia sp.]MCW9080471.1 sigma-54-dependent Fis family transcriptional regulator [Colwellia sp.]